MKRIFIGSIITNCLLFIFLIILVVSNFSLQGTIKSLENNKVELSSSKTKTNKNSNLESESKLLSNAKEKMYKEEIESVIDKFIAAYYNYDNKNYVSRMYEVEKYITDDVLKALLSDCESIDDMEEPKVNIKNVVNESKYLIDIIDKNGTEAYLILNNTYYINDKANDPSYSFIKVTLQYRDEEWLISNLSLIASGKENALIQEE